MKTSDFKYELPNELIAQTPLKNRSDSKMMVVDRNTKEISDDKFIKIIKYINKGDTIVFNDTKVIPARIFGYRENNTENNNENNKEKIEFLLTKDMGNDIWEVLVKPGKKAKIGTTIIFSDKIKCEVKNILEEGERIVKFIYTGNFYEILNSIGVMPLPPYITHKLEDNNRYQTIYNKKIGSVAAPTAGLHFTEEVINLLKDKGVNIAYITLHVGIGTFRLVKVDDVTKHNMHKEYISIDEKTAELLNNTKKNNKKVICVGTTSVRTIESATDNEGIIHSVMCETDIFIYPGYKFKMVDMLLTNFHLPESTLIMLVSALVDKDTILKAYNRAVINKYRFFSFGDCMLIKT
ncbi:MAG: tRNA preQ1(34) S-adenosylmethionine ribosyltransferase-isomerase QueA [Clostridia bacterium]